MDPGWALSRPLGSFLVRLGWVGPEQTCGFPPLPNSHHSKGLREGQLRGGRVEGVSGLTDQRRDRPTVLAPGTGGLLPCTSLPQPSARKGALFLSPWQLVPSPVSVAPRCPCVLPSDPCSGFRGSAGMPTPSGFPWGQALLPGGCGWRSGGIALTWGWWGGRSFSLTPPCSQEKEV